MTVTVTSALAGPATARYSNVYGALVDLGVLSGLGAQDVTGSGDPVAPILNASEFYAPLTHSLALTRGTGDPTFSRTGSTGAWEFDNEGKLINVPQNCARFGGARMVRNLLTYSENLSNAAWQLIANATVTGTNQLNLTTDANSRIQQYTAYGTAKNGDTLIFSVVLSGTGQCYLVLTEDAAPYPAAQTSVITLTATPTRYSVSRTFAVGGTRSIGAITKSALAAGATVIVQEPQLENVTGQADQTASEYVSSGVLSAPYHGAGVDGVKYFNTHKNGSPIPASTLLGYHAEGARTNNLLYSRDLTKAAWAKTNVTAAKTATGIDNAPNSASTLTAGAADATILQTLSLAAAARSFSAYVKRRTGSGNIYITRDGGTSWTDVTSQINSSTWTRVKIENTSVLNPSCGFKIATSGDEIDVDVCQDEAGSEAWSPIITTSAAVTRNADAETFPTASNWSDTAGWALATVQGESWANATGTAIGNGTNGLKLSASNSGVVAYDGTNTVNGPAGSPSGAEKLAMTWGSGALQAASGGVAGTAGSYDGAWGLATIGIGTSQGNVYIKDVYIGQSALTPAQIAQVTTP